MKTPILIIKQIFAVTAVVVLILSVNAGCSSGGDGDAVDIPATIPDVLNYEISQGTGVSLVVSQNPVATISSMALKGSFNRITEDFTLLNSSVPMMSVSASDFLSSLLSGEYNDYSLAVNTTLQWTGNGKPTSGEFDLRVGPVNRIRVSVNPDVTPGVAGVDITYSPTGDADPPLESTSVTWAEFDALFGSLALDYQQVAAFGYTVLRFIYEQGGLVIQGLELISENDTLLEETGTVEQSCDSFYPLTPTPAVSYDPGFVKVNWYDVNNDIGLGPGDTVYLGFTQCWVDDETDTIDTLYDGTINLVNYTEVQSGGVVTRIGFEPSVSGDGGVDFDYFKITETETISTDVIIKTGETITLSGGFSMVFTSP